MNSEILKEILQLNKLTPEQKKVVFCEKTPILVSASAGSGKTFALCNRILFKLMNPKNELNAKDLLVVSFTKAAADEIFNRLKNKLNSLIKQFPKETIFQKQLKLLSKNNITTIDSFCSNFLKEHFEAAKISYNFRIGNEIEFFEMKQTILENIFETERKNDLENFQKLSAYFNIKSDEGLKTAILKIFEKSRTNPFPEQFLNSLLKSYKKPKNLNQCKNLTNQVAQEIIDRINTAHILLSNSIDYMDDPVLKQNFQPIFEQNAFNLNCLTKKIETLNFEEIYKHIANFEFEPLPRYNKKTNNFDRNLADYIKIKFLNPAKKLIKSTYELLINNEQFLQDQTKQKPIVHKLVKICFIFSKQLKKQKKLTNTLEFSDLLLKTIELLAKPSKLNKKPELTQLGKQIKNCFQEVLIDEFQDINQPQNLLFQILSDNGKNLFAVGDIKQSIYRFRQADPEIFLNYKTTFKKQNKTILNLQHNFRSHLEITNSINFLFGQIMSAEFGGVDYEQTDALVSKSNFKPNKDYFTEFHILTNENDDETEPTNNLKFEMAHVATRINELIQNKFPIFEDGSQKPCEPKHFAILLRSEKQASKILCEELTKFGISFCVDEKNQFLKTYEVGIVVAMLKIVNNPLDDIAFCAIAKSPIFGFTNTELAYIKTNSTHNSLFSAFNESKLEKCKPMLAVLFKFRQKMPSIPISQLIQKFYNLEIFNNMFYYSNADTNQTIENLNNFLNLVIELEQNNSELTLNTFLNLIQTSKNSNLNLNSQYNQSFDKKNAVKIMTIHKSKGLEFPIVFLPLCAKKFNKQDFNVPIVVSNKFGLGLKHSNPEKLTRYNTLNFNCILAYEQNEAKAEELRLLYVAMTRAQQKLILVATDNNRNFKNSTTPNSKILPPSFCRTKNSFYDWLLASFMRHENSFFNKTKIKFNKKEFQCNLIIKNKFDKTTQPKPNDVKLNAVLIKNLTSELESRLNFKIQTNKLIKIPAKMSVSELTKPQTLELKKLSFKEENPSNSEIGTAMHAFLQHTNFEKAKQNLTKEINRLIDQEFISKKLASCLNLEQLTNFFNSKIFDLIKIATSIERERNFIFEIPAHVVHEGTDKTPIMVQGTIDLIIKINNQTIIVDYKTDRTTNKNLKLLYEKQLKIYRHALEYLTHCKVTTCLIYSFYSNSIITID